MYKIIYNGEVVAYQETPNYVKLHENGAFVNTDRASAEYIANAGVLYPISETVVCEADMGGMTHDFTIQGFDITDLQETVINQAVDISMLKLGITE